MASAAAENSLNAFIPELEVSVTANKISDEIKVDLARLPEDFSRYLFTRGLLETIPGAETELQDVVILTAIGKFPEFYYHLCQCYRRFKADASKESA